MPRMLCWVVAWASAKGFSLLTMWESQGKSSWLLPLNCNQILAGPSIWWNKKGTSSTNATVWILSVLESPWDKGLVSSVPLLERGGVYRRSLGTCSWHVPSSFPHSFPGHEVNSFAPSWAPARVCCLTTGANRVKGLWVVCCACLEIYTGHKDLQNSEPK
jgi:hypothetical protein